MDVRSLLRRYASAWANNDRDGWLSTFADYATLEDPVGTGVRGGRVEIGGFWDDAMAGYHSLAIAPRDIYISGTEAAMVWRITCRSLPCTCSRSASSSRSGCFISQCDIRRNRSRCGPPPS